MWCYGINSYGFRNPNLLLMEQLEQIILGIIIKLISLY